MNNSKKTLNQSLIYGIGIFLQHATAIIMLPIYTRYLVPEDYGVADLLAMGVEVVGLIVGVITSEAIFRFYYDKDSEDHRRTVVFTIFLCSLMVNLAGYLLILATSEYTASYLFEGTAVINGRLLVALYGATIVFQIMSAIPMAYIRAQQKPKLFVYFAALRLIIAVACNLYFVVFKELHIAGVVYAVFLFTAIHGVIMTIYMLAKTGRSWSTSFAKQSVIFSWPLMASSIALFMTTYSDRLFIKNYSGNADVGLYSLAYKFGFILISFAWTPFAQAWDAKRYEAVKQKNAIEIFQTVFRLTQAVVVSVALGISVFAQDLLRIMAATEFHEAYSIVGIIVFAYVFNIWSHYCVFGILYKKKTVYRAYVDWFVLFLTVSLYVLLIPRFGITGAAWSTFISLGVRFLCINYFASLCYDMQLEWRRVGPLFCVAGALYIVSIAIQLPLMYSILSNLAIMLLFVIYLFSNKYLKDEDWIMVKDSINSGMKKIGIEKHWF